MNETKLARLRAFVQGHGYDAVVIVRSQNFAWLTDGAASYVNIASDLGAAAAVVTADRACIVCDDIELPRLRDEESLQGWEFVSGAWSAGRAPLIQSVVGGKVCADAPVPGTTELTAHIAPLRYRLDAGEMERMRSVGLATGRSVEEAAREIVPGMSELQIAGLIADHAYAMGVVPIVNLVATDERCFRYRHPLPTARRLERYCMLVVCGRRGGLIASATRLVHFGAPPADLVRRLAACIEVEGAFYKATQPGNTLADAFAAGAAAYEAEGFPGEWQHHHQGGLTGYQTREVLATSSATLAIQAGMAFAWNPSIAGVKSEDTLLLTETGVQVVTETNEWPKRDCGAWKRPDILVR